MLVARAGDPCSVSKSATEGESSIVGKLVAKFELDDQYGNRHRVEFPRERVSVLTIADRKGSAQLPAWVEPVRKRFDEQVEILGVAIVKGVPGPFKGMVIDHFKEKVKYPVMLDWTGDVAREFQPSRNVANVYVIDCAGKLLHKTEAVASAGKLTNLCAIVEGALPCAGRIAQAQ